MKKITTLFMLFLCSVALFGQDGLQVEDLLQRYEALKSSPLSFEMVMNQNFTEAEQQLLWAHFDTKREFANSNRSVLLPDAFLGLDIRNGGVYGSLDGTPPYNNFDVINTSGLIAFADDFDANGTLYALQFDEANQITTLVTVDPISGNFAAVDDVAGFTTGHAPSGLSHNFDDGTMYALSSGSGSTQLYSLNLLTAVATPIGSGTGNSTGIWLEIDNAGDAWMADISNDLLYSVNLSTGSATPVGPLDVDISFAQDASYDHENNELFMAAYQGGGTGGIYSINTSSGLASFIGQTDALNIEFGMFSVPNPTLGTEDIQKNSVAVYPNPMENKLHIKSRANLVVTDARLYNVLGNHMGVAYSGGTLDVAALPRGVYILVMETSEGKLSQKVVKR